VVFLVCARAGWLVVSLPSSSSPPCLSVFGGLAAPGTRARPYGILYSLGHHTCTFFRFSLPNLKSRFVFSVLSTHQHYFFSERAVTATGYPTVHHHAPPRYAPIVRMRGRRSFAQNRFFLFVMKFRFGIRGEWPIAMLFIYLSAIPRFTSYAQLML